MSTINQVEDSQFMQATSPKTIPGSLNTLTILTFIGSGISLIGSIFSMVGAKERYTKMEELQASGDMDKVPGFMKGMVGPEAVEMLRKSYEYRIPLLIITLVGLALCVYGAMQMRALKKQGFYLWLAGEVFPIICSVILVGAGMFSGFGMLALIIPIVFIILYATQLKYMS
jgi:hypothetical protein